LDEEVEVVLEQLREELRSLERIRGWPEDVDVVVVGRDLASLVCVKRSESIGSLSYPCFYCLVSVYAPAQR